MFFYVGPEDTEMALEHLSSVEATREQTKVTSASDDLTRLFGDPSKSVSMPNAEDVSRNPRDVIGKTEGGL
jgi:hypothetical protein